ncbi:hypothetical protein BDA99DRAFT_562205 [Phascolomyces articulosus]|uniref:Distal membrane-arm assembly complex protein 1-like domain-containing protein n=1 Tax=Phascolomyces articulosus TaxID=60185 RepID=A0AAD5PBS2_9FUNG|nr:hypothetical protein BDA99DRAFT_562205 [Phascolomyces articulosus]
MSQPTSQPTEQQQQPSQNQEYQDCLPCKLTGAGAFGGLGAYALLEAQKIHKLPGKQGTALGLGVAGVVFVSAGLYRLAL